MISCVFKIHYLEVLYVSPNNHKTELSSERPWLGVANQDCDREVGHGI